jgi:phosphate-selective porin OprO and OprP
MHQLRLSLLLTHFVAMLLLSCAARQLVAQQQGEFNAPSQSVAAPLTIDPAPWTSVETAESASILERLARLEQLAAESTAFQTIAVQENATPSAPQPAESKGDTNPGDGWTDLSKEKWTVKLGGHVQMDYINWAYADPPVPGLNYFEFRRLRLLADGTGYGQYDFRLQIDIEPEAGDGTITPTVDVKDAYFTMHDIPLLNRWRIGNFFVPFSLEQVTNDTNNIFVERSIPTQTVFAAEREVGTAIYGVSEDLNCTWTTGVFFDSVSESTKESIGSRQGTRISGRLTYLPLYDEASNGRYLIHTGVGILYTDDFNDQVRLRTRPQVHEGPFMIDTGVLDATQYTTGNLELATVMGPFSVQSELFLSSVDLVDEDAATLYGGYVYCSYFLTGENRIYERFGQHGAQFARNVPYTNFFWVPGGMGSGAWEMKARISYVGFKEADAGQYNDLTVGFNWYWSDRIRWMFDWIHPVTSADTPFGATESDLIAMRFDFNW